MSFSAKTIMSTFNMAFSKKQILKYKVILLSLFLLPFIAKNVFAHDVDINTLREDLSQCSYYKDYVKTHGPIRQIDLASLDTFAKIKDLIDICSQYKSPKAQNDINDTKALDKKVLLSSPIFNSPLVHDETLLKERTFNRAKSYLYKVYKELNYTKTFYCGCDFAFKKSYFGAIDLKSCGYKIRKNAKRASRIEAEHIMPAYNFGRQLKCWIEGGRKNCKRDKIFNLMESDLHNLVPAIGEVNGDRSNFKYVQELVYSASHNVASYGQCPIKIDFTASNAKPPEHTRGQIARAYLYMQKTYKIKLSDKQLRLMLLWNNKYAPTQHEIDRNRLIYKYQKTLNPFIEHYSIIDIK